MLNQDGGVSQIAQTINSRKRERKEVLVRAEEKNQVSVQMIREANRKKQEADTIEPVATLLNTHLDNPANIVARKVFDAIKKTARAQVPACNSIHRCEEPGCRVVFGCLESSRR